MKKCALLLIGLLILSCTSIPKPEPLLITYTHGGCWYEATKIEQKEVNCIRRDDRNRAYADRCLVDIRTKVWTAYCKEADLERYERIMGCKILALDSRTVTIACDANASR